MSTTSDKLRRDWFRIRFSWYMQDYPGREYRRINRELRRELAGDDPDRTLREVLDELGHPRVLAEGYKAELPKRLPRLATGAAVAGLAVGFIVYLGLAYALGVNDTLEAMGGGSVTVYPFGAETTITNTAQKISLETQSSMAGSVFVVGTALVAFVLGSRLWRLLPRRD